MLGLVDIDNMYVSCERVWAPHLQAVPVAVLSNNDGCIISRSQELKDHGFKMGEPYFKVKDRLRGVGAHVFSSNYALYGDMSRRVMQILGEGVPDLEIYSIDEAFVDFEGVTDISTLAHSLKDQVLQYTGLPCCVGVGPTKTLAKLANRVAKKTAGTQRVFVMHEPCSDILGRTAVDDIWGIGRRLSEQLRSMNIYTAADLANLSPRAARSRFNVVVEKTVRELNGQRCYQLNEQPKAPHTIMVSRAFGARINNLNELSCAVATYAEMAAAKARAKGVRANMLTLFIQTNPFSDEGRYSAHKSVSFSQPTGDTLHVVATARSVLTCIFKAGHNYARAGVMLTGLERGPAFQTCLFDQSWDERREKLMHSFDALNKRFGRNTITTAAAGLKKPWYMSRQLLSPGYTSSWADLRRVG